MVLLVGWLVGCFRHCHDFVAGFRDSGPNELLRRRFLTLVCYSQHLDAPSQQTTLRLASSFV